MMRTQIYIAKTTHATAQQIAKEKDQTMAALFRHYIEEGLSKEKRKKQGFQALIDLKLRGGPSDLAEHMDDYLYGDK